MGNCSIGSAGRRGWIRGAEGTRQRGATRCVLVLCAAALGGCNLADLRGRRVETSVATVDGEDRVVAQSLSFAVAEGGATSIDLVERHLVEQVLVEERVTVTQVHDTEGRIWVELFVDPLVAGFAPVLIAVDALNLFQLSPALMERDEALVAGTFTGLLLALPGVTLMDGGETHVEVDRTVTSRRTVDARAYSESRSEGLQVASMTGEILGRGGGAYDLRDAAENSIRTGIALEVTVASEQGAVSAEVPVAVQLAACALLRDGEQASRRSVELHGLIYTPGLLEPSVREQLAEVLSSPVAGWMAELPRAEWAMLTRRTDGRAPDGAWVNFSRSAGASAARVEGPGGSFGVTGTARVTGAAPEAGGPFAVVVDVINRSTRTELGLVAVLSSEGAGVLPVAIGRLEPGQAMRRFVSMKTSRPIDSQALEVELERWD